MTQPLLLDVRGIDGGYKPLQIFRKIDLQLAPGGSVGLFGPNGHGKTTFLRTLSGIIDPWDGDIFFEGPRDMVLRLIRRAVRKIRHEADLAVTGKDRFPVVPNVPTVIESGVVQGYDVTTWYGVFAPRGTPSSIIAKLNATLNEILGDATVRQRLDSAGVVVQGSTPEAFGTFMAAEYTRWNAVREAAGIEQK
jgi:energy-coupling factor transporter ATP-binding protein EcfA2